MSAPHDKSMHDYASWLARWFRRWSFYALWLYVVSVSVNDAYWVVVNRSTIRRDERNPVGLWLIEHSGGEIWLFIAVKSAGTVLAATILLILYWRYPRAGWIACCGVAAFQTALLYKLLFF